MAATRIHRFLGGCDRLNTAEIGDRFDFELDEAEVWATDDKVGRAEPKTPPSNPRPLRKPARKVSDVVGPRSLPVSIPDWSKRFRGECGRRASEWVDDGNEKMPPHEYLAKTRVASLSVHEGIGRTLKGRDLSRVRNAIWKKTGFED